jgi:hypothetical protein
VTANFHERYVIDIRSAAAETPANDYRTVVSEHRAPLSAAARAAGGHGIYRLLLITKIPRGGNGTRENYASVPEVDGKVRP